MKKTNIKYFMGFLLVLFGASSCEDQLDINENPNQAIAADVQLVLPQAIVATASITNQLNNYGGHFGGFIANAGGFSGFGNLLNYNLTPGDYNGIWTQNYQDALQDLKYVMDNTEGKPELAYYNAAARIITVLNYQRLVDAFGDIPYSEALKGSEGILTPKYDDAFTIYKDLFTQLDQAITTIEDGKNATAPLPLRLTAATDPLFSEFAKASSSDHMTAWQRFANTLKLRMLLRLSSKADFNAFVAQGFANLNTSLGFITNDAIVDPGYELNKPNPEWATWGRTTTLTLANSSRIPTKFSFGFYNGAKLADPARGEVIYVNFPSTPTNQLGNEDGAPTVVSNAVTWAGNEEDLEGLGVLKGPGMGQPLMTAAEAYLLVAEAQLRDFISGGDAAAKASFNNGIRASIGYLYKDENEAMKDTVGLFTSYRANNASYLVNWDLGTNDTQHWEAIITQKYIALNMINSDEAWNEYRRTGFPVSLPGNANQALDLASNKSNITNRTDRMPTRVLYPSSEQSYNASNFRVVDYTREKIFWDPN